MTNRPFNVDINNIFNEVCYKLVPGVIGSQNVILEQTENRTITDTFSSCLQNSDVKPKMLPSYADKCYNVTVPQVPNIQTNIQYIPGGVSFTFSIVYNDPCSSSFQPLTFPKLNFQTNHPNIPSYDPNYICGTQQNFANPSHQTNLTLQDIIAYRQLENDRVKSNFHYEYLKPIDHSIDFHYNKKTSTTDLLNKQSQIPASGGLADFEALCAIIENLKKGVEASYSFQPSCSSTVSDNFKNLQSKKLFLSKSPDLKTFQPEEMYDLGNEKLRDENSRSNVQNIVTKNSNTDVLRNVPYNTNTSACPTASKKGIRLISHNKKKWNMYLETQQVEELIPETPESDKAIQVSLYNTTNEDCLKCSCMCQCCNCQRTTYPDEATVMDSISNQAFTAENNELDNSENHSDKILITNVTNKD